MYLERVLVNSLQEDYFILKRHGKTLPNFLNIIKSMGETMPKIFDKKYEKTLAKFLNIIKSIRKLLQKNKYNKKYQKTLAKKINMMKSTGNSAKNF